MNPTPEQIRAAHEAARAIQSQLMALAAGPVFVKYAFTYQIDESLPEPQRPRITPVRELAETIGDIPLGGISGDRTQTIRAARAEILAWLEWETTHAMGGHYPDDEEVKCSAYGTVHKLIAALREEDVK